MNYLADVNVWVAMTYDAHVHHRDATAWFDGATANGKGVNRVAFCRVTEMGLLRLLTNSRVMGEDVRSPAAAWATLDALYQDDRVGFAAEPVGLKASWRSATRHQLRGSNFWTDAYLGAFAESTGYTLVTFDQDFRRHSGVAVKVLGT